MMSQIPYRRSFFPSKDLPKEAAAAQFSTMQWKKELQLERKESEWMMECTGHKKRMDARGAKNDDEKA
jgi:hypothetical protein